MEAVQRSSNWAVTAPVACGCALVAGAAYLAFADPAGPGTLVPQCPLHATTGLWCPGCGLSRAAHAVLRGHLGAAFGYNMLFPFFFAAIAFAWLGWMRVTLGYPAGVRWLPKLPTWTPVAAAVVLVVFAILRNLPGLSVLAP